VPKEGKGYLFGLCGALLSKGALKDCPEGPHRDLGEVVLVKGKIVQPLPREWRGGNGRRVGLIGKEKEAFIGKKKGAGKALLTSRRSQTRGEEKKSQKKNYKRKRGGRN